MKEFRENIRVDMITNQLVYAMEKKFKKEGKKVKKSELYRSAIYRMAKEELTPDEFSISLQAALEWENR